MGTITISVEEYKELVRKGTERDIMITLMRRNYNASSNSCYRNNIDVLESFDEDFEEWHS